ncbi:hypothetical protein CMV16_08095 [Peribacillus simplex]|nr:hypothetical protein CMV16_08095 [Peribacillus simplex]
MSQINEIAIESFESQDRFINYFAIRHFIEQSLVPTGYKPSKEFENTIFLSEEGTRFFKQLKATLRHADDVEIEIALFLYSHSFIDFDKTQWEKIVMSLDNEIITKKVRYPWYFDNILYNKFFDEHFPHVKELSGDDTNKLIDDTPQGVYQMNNMIVGPFGIIYSQEKRFYNPHSNFLLWHCEDPACTRLHYVDLKKGHSVISDILINLKQDSYLYGSKTAYPHPKFFGRTDGSEYMHLGDLPTFLGQVFSEVEIKNILGYLLNNHSKSIRRLFPKNEKVKHTFLAGTNEILKQLGKPECLQLILLLKNEVIVEAIEILIEEQTIVIPPTETREMKHGYRTKGVLPIKLECSKFGIRAVFRKDGQKYSYVLLRSLISTIYDIENNPRRLHWKLRDIDKDNIYEKLNLYLLNESPELVIKNLILDDPEYIDKTFDFLKFGKKNFPKPEEEKFFIEKVLWKLGFNINIYPTTEKDFWKNHEDFLNIVQNIDKCEEPERNIIRSVGVNYFVSLEGILNNSLSFITWVLFAKHTNFKSNLNFYQARTFMANMLNKEQEGITEPLNFDTKGNNTLFPLIKGFELFADVCEKYLKKDRNEFKRTEAEIPGYHNKYNFLTFPFIHNILLFDLREEDIRELMTVFRGTSIALEKANVCNVRNRIKHDRPVSEFPQKQEFMAVLEAVKESIRKLELYGIVPTVFKYSEFKKDQFGRETISFMDYQGKKVSLFPNSLSTSITTNTLLIVNGLHLKNSIEKIRFSIEEESEYTLLWRGYPRRRVVEKFEKEIESDEIL